MFYIAEIMCVPAVLHRLSVFPHLDSPQAETLSEARYSIFMSHVTSHGCPRLPVPSPFIVRSPSIARS